MLNFIDYPSIVHVVVGGLGGTTEFDRNSNSSSLRMRVLLFKYVFHEILNFRQKCK